MNVLDRIFATKHDEVAASKVATPLSELVARATDCPPARGFLAALTGCTDLALIAEIKKASPSKGLIRPDFDAEEIARTYERAGANALSVLTDATYFQGAPENLRLAKSATSLPCLRKDFIDDPYQLYEARVWGADAVLLILASLTKSQAQDLYAQAVEIGLDVLVEVHTPEEAAVATDCGFPLVGVNNRNLADFKTDLAYSEMLLPTLTNAAIRVSESALETRRDLDRVKQAGAHAVLIGTTFTSHPDIEAKVREVMGR